VSTSDQDSTPDKNKAADSIADSFRTGQAADDSATYCGHVALVGRPNVGKSTLLNHVLRQKISITSRKPQTTRHNLIGVDTQGPYQALYIDTPGIHSNTEKALNKYMVSNAKSAIDGVDVRVMVIESGRWQAGDQYVADMLRRGSGVRIAVLSKVDLLPNKASLLPEMQRISDLGLFEEIVPVSALKQDGIDALRSEVFKRLPESPHYFDDDQVTDQTERHLVEEIIREKLMRQLGDEIPHSAAVMVILFDAKPNVTEIHAEIYVEREGQKRIVIGNQGQRLKLVGQEARKDIERLIDRRVMLNLWVKVRKGWTNSAQLMRRLGYD